MISQDAADYTRLIWRSDGVEVGIADSGSRFGSSGGRVKHPANCIEIPTLDLERAKRFYSSILGAELADMKIADAEYSIFGVKDAYNCGALVRGDFYRPSREGVVVYHDGGDDLSKILDRVKKAGGRVVVEKTFLPKRVTWDSSSIGKATESDCKA